MEKASIDYNQYVNDLVVRARKAQGIAETYDQEKVDKLCAALIWAACNEDFRRKAGEILIDESKIGNLTDKMNKIRNKALGAWRDMKDERSVGIVEVDNVKNLVKYMKPMGVIGALLPVTNGEATPIIKALWALKTRNAIIMAPHPNAKKTCQFVINYLREVLKKYDAPEDLIIAVEPQYVSIDCSTQVMKQVDFVVATGGTPMVRAAYSSGTPTIGVGTGNVTTYVDKSANLDEVADKIMRSKTFDYASSCSSENNAVVHTDVYSDFLTACEKQGAYVIKDGSVEKTALQKTIWPEWPANLNINRHIIGKSIKEIAEQSKINAPEGAKFIVVEENNGIGRNFPLTGEKLSSIVTVIKCADFEEALEKVEAVLDYQGKGHSCGIHTNDESQINAIAKRMKVSRILVNQPQTLGNSGAFFNGMPMTLSLGCGTWGHTSTCNNVTWKDIVNYTVVSKPINPVIPTEADLIPEEIRNA